MTEAVQIRQCLYCNVQMGNPERMDLIVVEAPDRQKKMVKLQVQVRSCPKCGLVVLERAEPSRSEDKKQE